MHIFEYLQQKYGVDKPTTMLATEAAVFGIPYPLQNGWLATYGGKIITEDMRRKLHKALMTRCAPSAASGLGVLGFKPTEKQMALVDRAARRAERRLARKNAQRASQGAKQKPASQGKAYKPDLRGVDVTGNAFLETYEWRRVRMEALKKYGPVCMCCGASPQTGAVMNVDHVKPRKLFPQLALDVDNLQILCHECNHGKGNWDQTDWRPDEFDPEHVAHLRLIKSNG